MSRRLPRHSFVAAWALCGWFSAGCGAPAPAQSEPATRAPWPPVVSASPAVDPVVTAAPPAKLPERFPDSTFPPADLEPTHERSAKPGDGAWQPLGDASGGDRAAETGVMVRTVLHPHPVSKFASLTVVAIDLARVDLHLVAGMKEPKSDDIPEDERTGLVSASHLARTLAIFNGGYKTNHGHWGVMVDGHTFVPPKDDACTIAIQRDGGVSVGSWPTLASRQTDMAAYRQTPPCLLEDGEVHTRLVQRDERPWGGRDPKRKTRRRSAVGIDASGRILFYGFGVETGPKLMAEGLRHAGAVGAAQLDINWSWTRFLLVGRTSPAAELQITSTLVPQMKHSRTGYVTKPAERDFFYLSLRPND